MTMLRSGPKVSLNVLILAVLVVGIGAFVAGWQFSGRDIGEGYIASPVNEGSADENDAAQLILFEEVIEEPMGIAIYVFYPRYQRYCREALMRSMDDVLEAKHLLAQRFLTRDTVWYGLHPDWRLIPVYVDDDARFYTPQEILRILDRRIRQYVLYTIRYGDSFEEIAYSWDMELSELLRINNIAEDTQPEPGWRVWVVSISPLVEIITIEESIHIVPLYRYVERIYVDTLAQGWTRVLQEGRCGYQEVIWRTTRRGSEIIDEAYMFGEIILEPVTMIVEIGQ